MEPRNQPLERPTAPSMQGPEYPHVDDLPVQPPHAARLNDLLLQQYELDERISRAVTVITAFFEGRHV